MEKTLEKRELYLALETVDRELKELQTKIKQYQRELEELRVEYRYLLDDEEVNAALRDKKACIEEAEKRLRELNEQRAELIRAIEEAEKRSEQELQRARKKLPEAVKSFYRARNRLIEALAASVDGLQERLKSLEEAVEAYYQAGEKLAEIACQAKEHKGAGWIVSLADLTAPARRLWLKIMEQEPVPEVKIEEEVLELSRWWLDLLDEFERLKRAKFPPCLMTLKRKKELVQLANEARRRLKRRWKGG